MPLFNTVTDREPLAPTGEDLAESLMEESAALISGAGRKPEAGTASGKAEESGRAAADDRADLNDQAMNFLEAAEDKLTYHQAELIRLACAGLDNQASLAAAQYVLDRARAMATRRPASRHVTDGFNDVIMDFVERKAARLTYHEAEIVRRAARGCDAGTVQELQYLLNRIALKLNGSESQTRLYA